MPAKAAKYYLGEINDDQPLYRINSATKPQPLRVISALDLQIIEQKIAHQEPKQIHHDILMENKRNLHLQSQSRIKNWDNTIAGQRKAREQKKIDQKLREEKRRKEIDDGFQADADNRRAIAVERARKMKYLESDEVKAFHSHLNHLQVLEEREMQIKLKKERMHAEGLADHVIMKASLDKCKEQEKEEAELQLLNRLQRVHLAQVHIAQQKQRRLQDYEEKKSLFEYGQKLAEEDRIYNEEQKNLALKKRQEELNLKRVLDEIRNEAIERKEMEKLEAKEEEQIIKAWAAHQEYKAMIKQKVEDDWKKKLYYIRTAIGENLQKQAINATEKEREIREQQVLEAEQKAKEEAERKAQKKKETLKELQEFQKLHQDRKAAQRAKETKEGQEALTKFRLDALAFEQEKQLKKDKCKKTEIEVTNYNRAQTVSKKEEIIELTTHKARRLMMRNSERQDILNETQTLLLQDKERREQMDEYIKSVASEPWAIKNQRITNYFKEKKSYRGFVAPSKRLSLADTHARIGFVGSSYSTIDLIGTNEICKGSAAQLSVEGSSVAQSNQ